MIACHQMKVACMDGYCPANVMNQHVTVKAEYRGSQETDNQVFSHQYFNKNLVHCSGVRIKSIESTEYFYPKNHSVHVEFIAMPWKFGFRSGVGGTFIFWNDHGYHFASIIIMHLEPDL